MQAFRFMLGQLVGLVDVAFLFFFAVEVWNTIPLKSSKTTELALVRIWKNIIRVREISSTWRSCFKFGILWENFGMEVK